MRFSPTLLDEIRARLSVSEVVGRKVDLKRAGREFKALSPFKAEKTPSLTVSDQKGFYHCFATGEHGDIFTFVMKTEGLTFPEAVERLAEEAGVAIPQTSPHDEAREEERERLYRIMEVSAAFFQALLAGGATQASLYLAKRGVTQDSVASFRLGYGSYGRFMLRKHLTEAGFTLNEMAVAGVVIHGEDIPDAFDRFRSRIMFPITDIRGRVIGFGGRHIDANAPAKYLNSPETPLFQKGHVLFNARHARTPAFVRGRVVVVEGFMDVIALTEAGLAETVAPMGTALTETQVKLLWRMADEPILCFDGDAAGRKAAFRAMETALPLLKPGFTFRFAFLPGGLDPDEFVRAHGAEALEGVFAKTRSMFEVLWEREAEARPLNAPEQRAAFETRLLAMAAKIGDSTVRRYYECEVKDRLWQQFKAGGGAWRAKASGQQDWRTRERMRLGVRSAEPKPPVQASAELMRRFEPMPAREALMLKTLVNHPWLIEEHAEEMAALVFWSAPVGQVRNALLELQASGRALEGGVVRSVLEVRGLSGAVQLAERIICLGSDRFAEPGADRVAVEIGWRETYELHRKLGS